MQLIFRIAMVCHKSLTNLFFFLWILCFQERWIIFPLIYALDASQTEDVFSEEPVLISKKDLRCSDNVSLNDSFCCSIVLSLQRPLFSLSVFKSICNSTVPWSLRAMAPISQSTTESTKELDIRKKSILECDLWQGE